jgi:hypothetical protein
MGLVIPCLSQPRIVEAGTDNLSQMSFAEMNLSFAMCSMYLFTQRKSSGFYELSGLTSS